MGSKIILSNTYGKHIRCSVKSREIDQLHIFTFFIWWVLFSTILIPMKWVTDINPIKITYMLWRTCALRWLIIRESIKGDILPESVVLDIMVLDWWLLLWWWWKRGKFIYADYDVYGNGPVFPFIAIYSQGLNINMQNKSKIFDNNK